MFRTIVRAFGTPKEMVIGEICNPPIPGPGQVLVRILLASINPLDIILITSTYCTRTSLPFVPGFKGVGMIKTVGSDISELKVSDHILPLGSAGAW